MKILEEYGIEEDPRFRRAWKEAKIIFIYMLAMWVLFLLTWLWGSHIDPATCWWIIGMPAYIFWWLIVGGLIFTLAAVYIALRVIKDCSLESTEREVSENE